MNSSRHLQFLVITCILVGVAVTLYQIFVLHTPVHENQVTNMWTVDARINLDLPKARAVDLEFYIPPRNNGYVISDELFVANGFGQVVVDSGNSRKVQWTARKLSGKQVLFYRFNLTKATDDEPVPGETWRAPIPLEGSEKMAVEAIIKDVRQKSADTISFISTAISRLNDETDDNVKLLLGKDVSPQKKIAVLEKILSQAHIPVEAAHLLTLSEGTSAGTDLWARSYIEATKERKQGWYYFNLETGAHGLPKDRLLWWVGDEPIIKSATAVKPNVTLNVAKDERNVLTLQQGLDENSFSLYSLPLSAQFAYKLMLMMPFGVFLILVIRNIVGIETLGTFTPVLIALAFRETGLVAGLVFFTSIVSAGLLLRAYLEHLKLQMLPRLSVVLTCVILFIITISMLSYKLGLTLGLATTLFPMVILTMTIERLSVTWEERGAKNALRIGLGTMVSSSFIFMVLGIRPLAYLVFTFPGILLIIIAFMLCIGRYSGYRLSELIRFKALVDKG